MCFLWYHPHKDVYRTLEGLPFSLRLIRVSGEWTSIPVGPVQDCLLVTP